MKNFVAILVAMIISTTAASANEFETAMGAFLAENIAQWASDPVLVDAIKAQNTETAAYDQAMIDELDASWRAFALVPETPMIADVLTGPAAAFLRNRVAQADGAITEAFVVDARGLNVAASAVTSDFWQGDEAKYQQTFLIGPDAFHFGDIELDDSTGTVQGQISMTIVDSETGEPIGALTVGIDLTALL